MTDSSRPTWHPERSRPNAETHDSFGFATGALGFELSPQGHEMAEILVSCLPAAAARSTGEPAFEWGTRLPSTQWTGNDWMKDAVHAALTATAHILVTRSGPALQPGPPPLHTFLDS